MQLVKKYLSLEFVIDIKNYNQSFEKWMKIRSRYHPINQQFRDELFNKYLQVIKPIIHRFDDVIHNFSFEKYGFYCSSLNWDQINIIKNVFKPLQSYQIVTQVPKQLLQNSQVESFLSKDYQLIYRLQVLEKPSNKQLKWWGAGMDISPVSIEGIVVTGKGEGKKNLGMPTANIQLNGDLQKKLGDYPNGVYLVDFDFINGQSYRGAGCLGTNPHYQNFQESRRMEVYVLHDFGDDVFYGSKVCVTLRNLIRFEGKFHTFDAFLHAMHNDIQIARSFPYKNVIL